VNHPVAQHDRVRLDPAFRISLQRTLRVPDDGRTYPLPPGLGRLPLRAAAPYSGVPQEWRNANHFLVPLYRREAAWLHFQAAPSDPRAVKVAVGTINAVNGEGWDAVLKSAPQNYLVCPPQPWLDGFKTGPNIIRQFIAVPLGSGLTVEGQLTGREIAGGIQIASFRPKPGAIAELQVTAKQSERVLGMGAGGQIQQRIYPDPYGVDKWNPVATAVIQIHLLEIAEFAAWTGEPPPPSPVDAETYTRFGLPWFEIYDSDRGDVPASEALSGVKPVDDLTKPVDIKAKQIRPIAPRKK